MSVTSRRRRKVTILVDTVIGHGASTSEAGPSRGVMGRPVDKLTCMANEDSSPVGFLGKLRDQKWLAWLTVGALVVLTLGGAIVLWVLETLTPSGF